MAYWATKKISTQRLSVLLFVLHIYLVYCVSTSIPSTISDDVVIRESVVIPSVDSEQEAKELYDQALKQYGSYGAFARNICSKLDLGDNNITYLPSKSFDTVPHLEELVLSDNTISKIDSEAFIGLHKLKRLSLHNCGLTVVPGEALKRVRGLTTLQLNGNAIMELDGVALKHLKNLRTLRLEGNVLQKIPTDTLIGLASSLEALNLGNNIFPKLPKTGLHRILHLKTFNNPKLREFPTTDTFPRIQTLVLSYAYRCCPFLPLTTVTSASKHPSLKESVLFPTDDDFDRTLWNNS